ncbi:MAG TPA: 3-hydroxyacyl-ACP dehydratase FabZ [Candidatus Solibacter sp.]|nr:3-hydroxyacyl-ACP dehydratase FabZ [Candidatus Solibacter sp.]
MAASVTPLETLSFEQVRGMLAHRFPFLMIDRVMQIERGKRLRALKHVTGNELCFLGHFPDHAIFPGVLILEAMAQSVSLLDLLSRESGPPSKYLGSAEAKFLAPVVPGDSMEIEAVLIKQAARGVIGSVHVYVQGKAVARAEIAMGTGESI